MNQSFRQDIRWAQTYHVKYLLPWRCICDVAIYDLFVSRPHPKGPRGKGSGDIESFLGLVHQYNETVR